MCRRLTRPLLVLLLLAQHGAVALLGAGLHALPGCGHRVVAARSSDGDDGGGVRSAGPGSSSGHGCAICDHLAQGQLAADPPVGPARPVAAPHPPAIHPPVPFRVPRLAFRPRAPPVPGPSPKTS